MKHWFISDLHIKTTRERNGKLLLRFLALLNQNPTENKLYFLGDIFDLWLSSGKAFQNKYKAIVDEIKKFKNNGGEVFYFEGNHDFHIDVFWTKKLGIPVYETEAIFKIGAYKVRMEHGDFINPDDKKYLRYRATVRKPWVEPLAHMLPSVFWKKVGESLSAKSRKKTQSYFVKNQDEIRKMIRTYAHKVQKQEDFDLLITGHMHVFDDYTFETSHGQTRSINLGTWLDIPRVVMIEKDKVEIHQVIDLVGLE